MARQVLENGVVLPSEYSDDWYDDMTSNLTKLDDVIGSDSKKLSSSDVGAAALSNNYNDLDNLPTIPTVNDATLTIQKNGVDVQTFTANASSNVTCNITVPTKTSDLTNDSDFVDTSNAAVSSGITSAKVTDYDTHIADTDIHVTTADKNRWNNNTYVFRYSSTALVASSTNSNTLLDNTDNLKVGDKVIDSSGVLFSITAIDTANSTFTIGTPLTQLAVDSSVMHLSGDETSSGNKNFSDDVSVKILTATGKYISDEGSTNRRTVLKLLAGARDTDGYSCSYVTRVRTNKAQGALISSDVQTLGFDFVENQVRTLNTFIIRATDWLNDVPQKIELKSNIPNYTYGSATNKAKINDLNPGSLGMPDLDNGIDISSYINVTQTSQYTAPADGYISICGYGTTNTNAILIKDHNYDFGMSFRSLTTSLGATTYFVMPVIKNHVYDISCNSVTTFDYAKFFPCQGNV